METTRQLPRGIAILRGLTLAAVLAIPAAILIVRFGWWQSGLLIYAIACALAAVLLVVSVVLSLLPRFKPYRSRLAGCSLMALPGSVLLAVTLAGSTDAPPIHDISTDLNQPPTFTHAPVLRGTAANSLTPDPATSEVQRKSYPDITTLHTPLAPDAAYTRAMQSATALDWEITYEDGRQRSLEAVATTSIMGFKDDVVIRLQANTDGGTRIDLRSVSRVGVGDMGANAARIRAFKQQFTAQE